MTSLVDVAEVDDLVVGFDALIHARRKTTSPLYRTILEGRATPRLLQGFVLQRLPVKRVWMRHLLAVASHLDDVELRRPLVENAYEEETGALTGSQRHFDSFVAFGRAVGITEEMVAREPLLPETIALVEHNLQMCNGTRHFTVGVASVILLMEGQPPITSADGSSLMAVMRDTYGLPPAGYEFFVHHASATADAGAASDLEDEHAEVARRILRRFCDRPDIRAEARDALVRSIDLRHRHFDAILRHYGDPVGGPDGGSRDL